MSNFRTNGFDAPLSHHDENSLSRLSVWMLIITILLFLSYTLIWSAAQMRVANSPPAVEAAPWHAK